MALPQFPCTSWGAHGLLAPYSRYIGQDPTAEKVEFCPAVHLPLYSFRRWIWPSTWPLLHGNVTATVTAAASRTSPSQKRSISGRPGFRVSINHFCSTSSCLLRNISANPCVRNWPVRRKRRIVFRSMRRVRQIACWLIPLWRSATTSLYRSSRRCRRSSRRCAALLVTAGVVSGAGEAVREWPAEQLLPSRCVSCPIPAQRPMSDCRPDGNDQRPGWLQKPPCRTISIEFGPIMADHLRAGMRFEPSRKAIGRAIRQ